MTGFGMSALRRDGREMTIELKSVNHRFLDISMKLPKFLTFLDHPFREAISGRLCRGHVELYITYRNTREDAKSVQVDTALLAQYQKAFAACGIQGELSYDQLLHMQGVLTVIEQEDDQQAVQQLALEALNQALDALIAMREQEGRALFEDLSSRTDTLCTLFAVIIKQAPQVPKSYYEKMAARIQELIGDHTVDETRLLNEAAVFADRCAIDEELVRFQSHVEQLRSTFALDEPIGRKMEFTLQELNRETNTIGSKANDVVISKQVTALKAELEKIREQIQNVE